MDRAKSPQVEQNDLALLEKSSITKRYKFNTFRQTLFDEYSNKLSVHCSDLSRNREFLVCGCAKNIIVVYDLIGKSSQRVSAPSDHVLKKNTLISIRFAFYYDYIIAGDSEGNILLFKLQLIMGSFSVDFLKVVPNLHDRPIFQIHNDASDVLFTVSSHCIKAHVFSTLILSDNALSVESLPFVAKIVAIKLHLHPDAQSIFMGFASGEVIQMQLSLSDQSKSLSHTSYGVSNKSPRYVSAIDVSVDGILLAVGYTEISTQCGYLMIFYAKRKKVIYQPRNQVTKLKLTHLLFFNDASHLVIGSRDGSILILNIKSKEILQSYSCEMVHAQGLIGLFFMQDEKQFPTLLSVGQEHVVTKTYFGQLKENMMDYVPFIFWVEMRIRQELDYKSELIDFLKSLFLGSIGIDIIKKQMHKTTVIGFEIFAPLLKRVVDYDEYESKNRELYRLHAETKEQLIEMMKVQELQGTGPRKPAGKLPILLPPLQQPGAARPKGQPPPEVQLMADFKNRFINDFKNIKGVFEKARTMKQGQQSDEDLLEERQVLYSKIVANIDVAKVQILNFSRCAFLFDERLPFKNQIYTFFNEASQLKYLDISYNMLTVPSATAILDHVFKDLEFLGLAHNNLGQINSKRELKPSDVSKIFGRNMQVSLRANGFSDEDGETILNAVRQFSQLKILDISGNLEFGDKTLIALQRLTVTEKRVKFTARKDQKNLVQLIRNMSFLHDNKMLDDDDEQDTVKEDIAQDPGAQNKVQLFAEEGAQNADEESHLIHNKNIVLAQPKKELEDDQVSRTLSLQSNKSQVDISLQLLCLQMKPERCEQAMKTATDFLVQNKIPNLYIYVVDNKIDNVWESSIATFYLRALLKQIDHLKNCLIALCMAFYNGISTIVSEIANNSLACIKQCCCSTFFLYKYILCCVCTFLTSVVGSVLVSCFGQTEQVFEVLLQNDFEVTLKNYYRSLTIYFVLNYLFFYAVVLVLPALFVLRCSGVEWLGHFIYLAYSGYSITNEVVMAYICETAKMSLNQYNQGSCLRRTSHIIKDLFIGQLTRFDVFANLCFISLVHFCGFTVEIAYLALSILGLNFLIEAYMVTRLIYKQVVQPSPMIDYLCTYAALTNITMVNTYLQKWTTQGSVDFIFDDIPTQIFSALMKLLLQDVPLTILQIIYLSLNPSQGHIGILRVSLAVSIVHMILSLIQFLSASRASRITDAIMTREVIMKTHVENKLEDKQFGVQMDEYIKEYRVRQSELLDDTQSQHLDYIDCLQGTHDRTKSVVRPTKKLQHSSSTKVVPLNKRVRKGITQFALREDQNQQGLQFEIEDHLSPLFLSKGASKPQAIAEESEFQLYSTGYAFLQTYEFQMKKWQMQKLPNQVREVILTDISRQHFTPNIEWDIETELNFGVLIHPMRLQALILAFFQPCIKRKKSLRILDLGLGSGYMSLAMYKLCQRVNPNAEVKIIALEHMRQVIAEARTNINYNGDLGPEQAKIFEFKEFDCLRSIKNEYPNETFDIINVGFAVTKNKLNDDILPLLVDDGVMFHCEIITQDQHQAYKTEYKNGQIETTSEETFSARNYQVLTPKELQDITFYKDINLYPLKKCDGCGVTLGNVAQFINPFWDQAFCITCAMVDNGVSHTYIEQFSLKSNLIYWDGIDERQLQGLNTKRLGKNRQPVIGRGYSRQHEIQCNGCGKGTGAATTGFRYLCLGCDKSVYSSRNGFCDFCEKCGTEIIKNPAGFELKVDSRGHSINHCLLRIIFNFGYYKY